MLEANCVSISLHLQCVIILTNVCEAHVRASSCVHTQKRRVQTETLRPASVYTVTSVEGDSPTRCKRRKTAEEQRHGFVFVCAKGCSAMSPWLSLHPAVLGFSPEPSQYSNQTQISLCS